MTAPTFKGCDTKVADAPDTIVAALAERLDAVSTQTVALSDAAGRTLAQPIVADRDSPPADVSAMDGYAVRLSDATGDALPVAGEVLMGCAPPALPPGQAVRIFTGGATPAEAEAVVRREHTEEAPDRVTIDPASPDLRPGANIRRRGENTAVGDTVIEPGCVITAAHVAAMASFGVEQVEVRRPVRVAVVVTGDELRQPGQPVEANVIRDSNGPTLRALLSTRPWVDVVTVEQAADQRDTLSARLDQLLRDADALITTGGVSMGDRDYVSGVIADLGGEAIFHGLPIRPGRPMLGALGPAGQLILGLPGNPLSVITTITRFGLPLLARRAGIGDPALGPTRVRVTNPDPKVPGLWWYRPVRLTGPGEAALVPSKGSGDLVSLARSDGFVELPAESAAAVDALFWGWP